MKNNMNLKILKLLILFLIVAGCESIFAPDEGEISGTVVNEYEGPVYSAKVYVGDNWTLTDKDGNFTLNNIPTGTHKIEAISTTNYYGSTEVTLDETTGFFNCDGPGKKDVTIILKEKEQNTIWGYGGTLLGGGIQGELVSGTWYMTKANSPYDVTGDLTVKENATLIIEPGVIVKMGYGDNLHSGMNQAKTELIVYGELIAQGSPSEFITFTSELVNPNPEDWYHIRFQETSINSILEYCEIKYSRYGIYCYDSSPQIRHCRIHNNYYSGIYCHQANPDIQNNIIFSNSGCALNIYYSSSPIIRNNLIFLNNINNYWEGSIRCSGSNPIIIYNTITKNENQGIYLSASQPVIENNIIYNNESYGIYSSSSSPTIDYNNVYGHTWNYYNCSAGNNDISTNAMFVDETNNNYHLQGGSPCLTASETGGEIGAYGNGGNPPPL